MQFKIKLVVFHNGSNYDYNSIIKELAKGFEGQFKYLDENTEKYTTFSMPIKKGFDNSERITHTLKFIYSFRFMSSSLSNLVDNLSERVHSVKCTDYILSGLYVSQRWSINI